MVTSVETIWETFHLHLKRFIRSRVPDEDAAEDLLQDVYLKIHTHLHQLCDDQRLQAWVYQIARNTIHDYYRSRRLLVELPETLPAPDTEDDDAIDDLHTRLLTSVESMIESLPHDYREALILTEYEGISQQALADRLGLSLSGAKSRVQRGRKLLKEMLLTCCHFQFDRLGKVIDYYPHCGCDEDTCAC